MSSDSGRSSSNFSFRIGGRGFGGFSRGFSRGGGGESSFRQVPMRNFALQDRPGTG